MSRELYARVGLSQVPHILGLVDRHRLSPTYGCFDRSYWHYRTAAFPSGMYQEFVLPLALIHRHRFPGGEAYCGQPRLMELAVAGMRYAARSAHRDGSCDDYFPYERALGAVAFSLYAMTESYLLLAVDAPELKAFFEKRGRWLMGRQESGRLSNHHALTVMALHNVHVITGLRGIAEGLDARLQALLSWQHEEGWFPEYEGCDPGYLTATIDFLAKYHRRSGDERVWGPLARAVRFAAQFMHPDGSYGGEYGSRNSALFFPHGFELVADRIPEARAALDRYLRGIDTGRRVFLDDDRMCAHLTYNHLQAFLDYHPRDPNADPPPAPPSRRYWTGAGLFVQRDASLHAVVSAAKGGVLRVYRGGELAYGDSGLAALLEDGTVLVSHLVGQYETEVLENGIRVAGSFAEARFRLPSPLTQALFHVGMLVLGRWGSDRVRSILQKLLIVGKKAHAMRFQRTLRLGDQVVLVDEIWRPLGPIGPPRVASLYAGTDHTSVYVAVSRSYQAACLQPWTDYGPHLESLNRDGYARMERVIA
jgi:hypothetical protein